MTSLRELGVHNHHFQHHPHNKITKVPRGGKMVKPILKALTSSPKNSLDLDRGWEEQPVDFGCSASSTYETGRPSMSRSVRDVSFQSTSTWETSTFGNMGGIGVGVGRAEGGACSVTGSGTATPVHAGPGGHEPISPSIGMGGGMAGTASARAASLGRPGGRYHHRTTSGTSHVSIATTGSSHRPGASFVHPFQQTPRTNTPPLTYSHSFTSFERDTYPARDYSPTIITENDNDDDADFDTVNLHPASLPLLFQSAASARSHHLHHRSAPSNSHSATSLRPSIASDRTSSLSDIRVHQQLSSSTDTTNTPSLRLNTTHSTSTSATTATSANLSIAPRSVPSAFCKRTHALVGTTAPAKLDLAISTSPTDSPRPSIQLGSPATSNTAMSPNLRTSLEGAFRLRSRSEVEAVTSRVDIREARRRFEEAERIKQEKYEAEQRRKQERKQEKERAHLMRKNTGASDMSIIGRPSFARNRTPPLLVGARRTRSGESSAAAAAIDEKAAAQPGAAAFMSSNYETTEGGAAPAFGLDVHDVRFETPQRAHTTKRKTQSYWTSFVLWFRTRLLRLSRH